MSPLNPSRSVFAEQAALANVIPVWTEIVADGETPVSAFAKIGGDPPSFLLESAEQSDQVGRYSFLGAGARLMISARNKSVTVTQNGEMRTFEVARDPLDELQKIMSTFRSVPTAGLPGFHGGAVGYLGYDCVRWFEPTIAQPPKDELAIPDMFFLLTGSVLVFDHRRRRLKIVANAFVQAGEWERAYDSAAREIEAILEKLARPISFAPIFTGTDPRRGEARSNTTREEYYAMVSRAREYIYAGDIFRWFRRSDSRRVCHSLDLYRTLRLSIHHLHVLSALSRGILPVGSSPECVRLTDDLVEIRPIAGTRSAARRRKKMKPMRAICWRTQRSGPST
jgi:anthranilate synthase component 1